MHAGGKILLSTTWGVMLFAVLLPYAPNGSKDLFAEHYTFDLPPRHHVIESLSSPQRLRGWNRSGLLDEHGGVISLPGIEDLPDQSPILHQIVSRGIEIGPDGRVYGLLPINHWCGNDPIALHLARVDVASVLDFVASDADCREADEDGWRMECFDAYERSQADAAQRK